LLTQKETTAKTSNEKRIIIFEDGQHLLDNIFCPISDCIASSLNIIGKPMIVYNIEKILLEHLHIDHIMLPEGFSHTVDIIQDNFPLIQINEYRDNNILIKDNSVRMPLDSIVVKSQSDNHVIRSLAYPWDVLKAIHDILGIEVTKTMVSKNTSIAETSIVKGPCIIEEGVSVDDFTKIVGPTYIEKNSKVGTSSLVRKCMIGKDSTIGFGCEIGRTFLVGNNRISHHDVILDTIIGRDGWLGAFVGTTNVLLNKEVIKYKLDSGLIPTGLGSFGAIIGHGCAIGAGVIILPGRFVPPKSIVQAGTIFSNFASISSKPSL